MTCASATRSCRSRSGRSRATHIGQLGDASSSRRAIRSPSRRVTSPPRRPSPTGGSSTGRDPCPRRSTSSRTSSATDPVPTGTRPSPRRSSDGRWRSPSGPGPTTSRGDNASVDCSAKGLPALSERIGLDMARLRQAARRERGGQPIDRRLCRHLRPDQPARSRSPITRMTSSSSTRPPTRGSTARCWRTAGRTRRSPRTTRPWPPATSSSRSRPIGSPPRCRSRASR